MARKSDQEPALKELLRAIGAEGPEKLELQLEESPLGDSTSNGEVEGAIRTVQGQVGTIKLCVQRRCGCNTGADHPIWPWLAMYSALLLNICLVGDGGRMASERRKEIQEAIACAW